MNTFIKENLSLVAALALPVLFAGFFFVSKQIGAPAAPPPQHDFVLAQDNQYGGYDVSVIDGALKIKFTYPKKDASGYIQPVTAPPLYYVDAKSMVAERIGLEVPVDAGNPSAAKQGTNIDIPVQKFEGKKFTAAAVSPDGYELTSGYGHDGNLMTEIFSANRSYNNNMILRNGGTNAEIKGLNANDYGLRVIGWVTPSAGVVPGE
jgi:hypothetical protein